jgi:hypothetical protein
VLGFIYLIGTQACIFDGYMYVNGNRSKVNRVTMNGPKDHIDGVGTFANGIFFFNTTKP